MPLSEFAKDAAQRFVGLKRLALDNAEQVRKRALELYNKPEQRNQYIVDWFIKAGLDSMMLETGNELLATAYWEQVDGMVEKTLDELSEIPAVERGHVWYDAAGVIVSTSRMQAQYESGMIQQAMVDGVEMGEGARQAAKGLTVEQLNNAQYNIKQEIKKLESSGV